MMSGLEISTARTTGILDIEPYSALQLKGVSYVLRLGNRYRLWLVGEEPVRLWSSGASTEALGDLEVSDTLRLDPGRFVLGSTLERIRLSSGLAGLISPLSHVARFGLGVTCGADLINPGFGGAMPSPLTLELFNHNVRPLELSEGMPVAHLRLFRVPEDDGCSLRRSIYEGMDTPTPPLLYEEWHPLLTPTVQQEE